MSRPAPTDPNARRDHETTVLLLGNVNVGKTTLFNHLCRKKSKAANYPGTSVSVGRGTFSEAGIDVQLIDTPGIDGMMPESEDERVSRDILLDERPDAIAVVADGKNLRKALLLTWQLADYGIPLVLNVNMMDEVRQRGIQIDLAALSSRLGVPVTTTVATEGEGVSAFRAAMDQARPPAVPVSYPPKVESAISITAKLLKDSRLPARAIGTALAAGDKDVRRHLAANCDPEDIEQIEMIVAAVQCDFTRPLSAVMLEARLRAVDEMLAEVQSVSPPSTIPFSEKIGEWSRRPLTGIPIAALVIVLMYLFVGKLGAEILVGLVEGRLFGDAVVPLAEKLLAPIPSQLVRDAFVGEYGLISLGLSAAFGIVAPVLATFFFAFGILEDSGYLPRLSILLDRMLRRIGLNGKGILPLIMGFSCVTMAILTTRILETRRERFIATLLLVLGIPCGPVLAVMLVLLAPLSIWAPVVVFGVIALQIVIIGSIAGKILPGERSDFILELPPMRIPKLRVLLRTASWRIWWFAKEAVPLFLLATFILFVLDRAGMLVLMEEAAKPVLTRFLGLPQESVGVLIMTVIRKESGAAMLNTLVDDRHLDGVQIVVSLLLLAFFLPCVNAILVMIKERGLKGALCILMFVTSYALVVGASVNAICRTLGVSFEG